MPLKPKMVPKKPDDMMESNFKLKAKEHKKKRHSTFEAEKATNGLKKLKAKEAKSKKTRKQGKGEAPKQTPQEKRKQEKATQKKKTS
ncbi:unnamed protein product [Allacma fusca]|uniref:Uncharacterized protein n=1 Tax=Allacma fusca TaxID=39272 RepID=A0A8J2K125_9HEXA|nr:unnamed protein product [Allacma fusca]